MKKIGLVLLVAVMVFLAGNSGVALADETSEARWNLAKKGAGFVAGFASGVLFHEAGHEIVARLENVNINWSGTRWTVNAANNTKLRHIALAGFGAQIISTEILLGLDQIPKDNSYVLGWLAFNVIESFYYPLRNQLRDDGYGDIKTLRKAGIDTAYVEIGLIAHGLLTAYRIYHNPKFIPYVKATKEELILGIGWSF
ncbi:hypothetical protein KJ590_00315 [Patescibacteria group bacterium]|nr:hypothetical protein [Patescibacteria group bacterium]MBU4142431.1 hypothetical protein [Patescibacteria group bacterium]